MSTVPFRPTIWSIAGLDTCSGAGIAADIKASLALGVHCSTAISAITAQNSSTVTSIKAVDPSLLNEQLLALAQDNLPEVIKTGMLGSLENLLVVCQWIDRLRFQGKNVQVVVDPVLRASTGASFVDPKLQAAYLEELLPRATVVTPNVKEAEQLGLTTNKKYPFTLVITGGDIDLEKNIVIDRIASYSIKGKLIGQRVPSQHNHGTGCTFSSSIASTLALGFDLADAIIIAKMATVKALRTGYAIGPGNGIVCALCNTPFSKTDLPIFVADTFNNQTSFPALKSSHLGIYALVDSSQQAEQVIHSGVKTLQLRIKNTDSTHLTQTIRQTVALQKKYPEIQLFINDHWELAIAESAYGVHLGYEDLANADLAAIAKQGLRLGLSTHSYFEMSNALALTPSYVACGPVFSTKSKSLPWKNQELDNIRFWVNLLDTPLVAIGGIDNNNIKQVAQSQCNGAAILGSIAHSKNLKETCKGLQEAWDHGRKMPPIPPPYLAHPTHQSAP